MLKIKDEDVIKFAKESRSIAELGEKLGYPRCSGAAYRMLRLIFNRLQVDTSHFTGHGWNKGKNLLNSTEMRYKYSKEEVFGENSPCARAQVKKLIIENNLLEYKCSECSINEWRGVKVCLQLDHINGIRNDNRLENLRLLCPNCHSLTETYTGKNKNKNVKFSELGFLEAAKTCSNIRQTLLKLGASEGWNYKRALKIMKKYNFSFPKKDFPKKDKKINKCLLCSSSAYNKYCSYECSRQAARKIVRPTKEELINLIKEFSILQISKKFKVNDNSIRKWCRDYEIDWKSISPFCKKDVRSEERA